MRCVRAPVVVLVYAWCTVSWMLVYCLMYCWYAVGILELFLECWCILAALVVYWWYNVGMMFVYCWSVRVLYCLRTAGSVLCCWSHADILLIWRCRTFDVLFMCDVRCVWCYVRVYSVCCICTADMPLVYGCCMVRVVPMAFACLICTVGARLTLCSYVIYMILVSCYYAVYAMLVYCCRNVDVMFRLLPACCCCYVGIYFVLFI